MPSEGAAIAGASRQETGLDSTAVGTDGPARREGHADACLAGRPGSAEGGFSPSGGSGRVSSVRGCLPFILSRSGELHPSKRDHGRPTRLAPAPIGG